jgi:hypothetical protein
MLMPCVPIRFSVCLVHANQGIQVSGTGVCEMQSLVLEGDVQTLYSLDVDYNCQPMAGMCMYGIQS